MSQPLSPSNSNPNPNPILQISSFHSFSPYHSNNSIVFTASISPSTTINLNINVPIIPLLPLYPPFPLEDIHQLELLGKGSSTHIYKAYHKRYHRFIGLKRIPLKQPQAPLIELSIVERLQSLSDPIIKRNIVHFYGIYQDSSNLYIEMEPGVVSLQELLNSGRKFSVKEAIYIVYSLTITLKTLKTHSIAHRDIKPSNIFLFQTKKAYIYDYKLGDFGIGCIIPENESLINKKSLLGYTIEYVAPELQRILDYPNIIYYDPIAADIYSLGIMGLKLLDFAPQDSKSDIFEETFANYEDFQYILSKMLLYDTSLRIGLDSLLESLEKIITEKCILPPKVERVYIEKALEKRVFSGNIREYALAASQYVESFEEYLKIGKLNEAGHIIERSLMILARTNKYADCSPEEMRTIFGLAFLLEKTGKLSWSEKLYIKALSLGKDALRESEHFYPDSLVFLGTFYYRFGKYELSKGFLVQALDLSKSFYGEKHLFTGNAMRHLGETCLAMRDFKNAYEYLLNGYDIIYGVLYSEFKSSNNQILLSLIQLLNSDEVYHINVLVIMERIRYGEEASQYPPILSPEALEIEGQGLTRENELYIKAYKSRQKSWKRVCIRVNKDLAKAIGALGRFYMELGDEKKAERFIKKGLRSFERLSGEVSGDVLRGLIDLGDLEEKRGENLKAEKIFLRALYICNRIYGVKNIDGFECYLKLEKVYKKLGKWDLEEIYSKKGLELAKELLGTDGRSMDEFMEIWRCK